MKTILNLRGLCAVGFLATSSLAAAATHYTITDLGTLRGSGTSDSTAINSAGTVTGSTATGQFEQSAGVFADGAWTDLGALALAASGGWTNLPYARGINDAGQITGYGFVTGGAGFHAFVYAGGVFTDLNSAIGGTKSQGAAINASGQVAGFYNPTATPSQVHAFRYSDGTSIDLGTLGGTYAVATALNAGGTVVGESQTSGGVTHAFSSVGSGMTDLGTLEGAPSVSSAFTSTARGINATGVIVGDSNSSVFSSLRAARYAGGGWQDLGTLGGAGSSAQAINDAGVIVGEAEISMNSSLRHAFVWEGGVMSDLNDLIPAGSGWELLFASAINASGQIVGQGTNGSGARHAYLLTPIGVPTAIPSPTVTIAGPKKVTTAKARLIIKGRTTGSVTSVACRIGHKPAKKARGIEKWTFTAALRPGQNKITVIAHGPGGDSAPASLTVIYGR